MDYKVKIKSALFNIKEFFTKLNYNLIIKGLWIAFFAGLLFISTYTIAVIHNAGGLFGEMPGFEVLENPRSELASELYSADNVLLGKYFRKNRSRISYDEISENARNALLATEDIRFYKHSGIDLKGTLAIIPYLLMGETRGSSTITQQLAKNLFNMRSSDKYEGSLTGVPLIGKVVIKTKEWITAIKIERSYTKKEIITMYLNTVDFGSNSFGIKVASRTFFNTTPDSLNVPQAATLIGLLKAPTLYSPVLNPENALERRNTVISQMEKYNFITPEEEKKYKQQPLNLKYNVENQNQGIATYFRKVVHNYLRKWCEKRGYDLYGDGLKIYTTIDSRMQQYAEEAVKEHMTELQQKFFDHWEGKYPWINSEGKTIKGFVDREIKKTDAYKALAEKYNGDKEKINKALKKERKMKAFSWEGKKDTTMSLLDSLKYYKHFLHAGFMSMDPKTGRIKSWVGGIDHEHFKFDHVIQGKRQAGSTFKPFVYCAALDNGYSPCDSLQDTRVSLYQEESKTVWTPRNYGGGFSGEYLSLREAMAKSINSITARLMKDLSPATVADYAQKLGLEGPIDPVPSLSLGTSDVSVYNMVGAYSTFVNNGIYTKPLMLTRIEDKNGNVLQKFVPQTKEVLNKVTADLMVYMLRGATEIKGGTAQGLRLRYPTLFKSNNQIGGKTGTTQNYSDGWFMGINHDLVTGIWVGGDHRSIHFRTGKYGQGARMAMPIYGKYMEKIYNSEADLSIQYGKFKLSEKAMQKANCSRHTNDSTNTDSAGQDSEIYKPGSNNMFE